MLQRRRVPNLHIDGRVAVRNNLLPKLEPSRTNDVRHPIRPLLVRDRRALLLMSDESNKRRPVRVVLDPLNDPRHPRPRRSLKVDDAILPLVPASLSSHSDPARDRTAPSPLHKPFRQPRERATSIQGSFAREGRVAVRRRRRLPLDNRRPRDVCLPATHRRERARDRRARQRCMQNCATTPPGHTCRQRARAARKRAPHRAGLHRRDRANRTRTDRRPGPA